MKSTLILTMFLAATLSLSACESRDNTQQVEATSTKTAAPEGAAAGPATAGAAGANVAATANNMGPGDGNGGKVVETMDSGGYTYALVETGNGPLWIAGPETPVSVGDTISFPPGSRMEKFRSETLGREFARIDFVTAIEVVGGVATAPTTAADAAPANTDGGVGEVLETMDAGGYTYVRIVIDGAEKWAAGPETELVVGDRVALASPTTMNDFHSPTLNRTFDSIEFVGSITVLADGEAAPEGNTGASTHTTAPAQPVDGIEKPENGVTIADIYEKRAELSGQEIVLRAKVVKFNANIMNANWIHVQDGSGDSTVGSHDITVTTGDVAAVGNVVLIKGKVVVNKDFGSGYRYDVMVEEATITVE